MEIQSIANQELIHFLKPEEPADGPASYQIELADIFREILRRANDFVPAEAGSIFIRDSTLGEAAPVELVVAASFGADARRLIGERLPLDEGIAGRAFERGQTFVSAVPSSDLLIAEPVEHRESPAAGTVVALPLTAGGRTVGVLELLKERAGEGYDERELELLELFAHTISAWIANAVEAQRSKEMARRDDLTHLFNDRYLHHTLTAVIEEALANDRNCALLFLDLDHFKNVNDSYGHLVGSRVLHEVGVILRQVLPGLAVPARYGGDEFVIILPESTRQEAFWVAETIRKTIETHMFLDRPDPRDPVNYPGLQITGVTCSVGLATLQDDTLPLFGTRRVEALAAKNELIRQADTRMYRAKDGGRNHTVQVDPEPTLRPQAAASRR